MATYRTKPATYKTGKADCFGFISSLKPTGPQGSGLVDLYSEVDDTWPPINTPLPKVPRSRYPFPIQARSAHFRGWTLLKEVVLPRTQRRWRERAGGLLD